MPPPHLETDYKDHLDLKQRPADMDDDILRLQSSLEDTGRNLSADHSEDHKSVIKRVKELAVARALPAHKAELEHQRYKA